MYLKAGRPRTVLDPYEWLPGYGESGVQIRTEKGSCWTVEITYDDESRSKLWKRNLRFSGVCSFYQASFPGVNTLALHLEASEDLGSLVEYPESEAALEWRKHFQNLFAIKHYLIYF